MHGQQNIKIHCTVMSCKGNCELLGGFVMPTSVIVAVFRLPWC